MNDLINLDFLKSTESKLEKKLSSKGIHNFSDKKEGPNGTNAFQINNIIINEKDSLEKESADTKATSEEESILENNIPLFNFSDDKKDLKTNKLNPNSSLQENNPRLQMLNNGSRSDTKYKKHIQNEGPTFLSKNKKENHKNENFKNTVLLNSNNSEHYENDNRKNLSGIFSSIRGENKKKFTSLFKNYLNFSNKKKFKNKSSMIKIITSNQLITEHKPNNSSEKIFDSNFNNFNRPEVREQEKNINKNNSHGKITEVELNVKDALKKEENSTFKSQNDNNLNNFDRLKNILDIKNNDISTRMTEIFERNIKLGNTKFEIQIRPENFGKIEINIEMNGDSLDLNLKTDSNQAVQILSENSNNLQKMLQSQGLTLNNFNLNQNNNKQNSSKNNNNQLKKIDGKEKDKENNIDKSEAINTGNLVYIKA